MHIWECASHAYQGPIVTSEAGDLCVLPSLLPGLRVQLLGGGGLWTFRKVKLGILMDQGLAFLRFKTF